MVHLCMKKTPYFLWYSKKKIFFKRSLFRILIREIGIYSKIYAEKSAQYSKIYAEKSAQYPKIFAEKSAQYPEILSVCHKYMPNRHNIQKYCHFAVVHKSEQLWYDLYCVWLEAYTYRCRCFQCPKLLVTIFWIWPQILTLFFEIRSNIEDSQIN